LAHEATHWARTQNRFDDYSAQVFRAYFERGQDIGDVDVLVTLADETGLDGQALRQTLTTHEFLDAVLADERDAATIGISGVPAFIANRKAALSGVQPVENLIRLVESVRG
jgi:predicted DsbA family dithiol-disulfide isomerase